MAERDDATGGGEGPERPSAGTLAYEVARRFFTFADLMEIGGGPDAGKAAAYRRAAIALRAWAREGSVSLEDLVAGRRLQEVPGIGPALARKVEEFAATGRIEALERLRASVPPGLVDLLALPGVGARTVGVLWRSLQVTGLDELEAAARAGRLREVPGLGPRREQQLMAGIAELKRSSRGVLLGQALPAAEALAREIGGLVAGAVRRFRPLVAGIELVAPPGSPLPDPARFAAGPEPAGDGWAGVLEGGIPVRCRRAADDAMGVALLLATGSEAHLAALGPLPAQGGTEEEVYAALGLPFIVPELREGAGEVEAARQARLPHLVERRDLRGDLHCHTNWSDGFGSLAAMAAAARARGYQYMAITDHSASLHVAHGLDVERLRAQRRAIDQLNAGFSGFRILHGSEVEVRRDGTLDFPDEVLAELDFVIASLHSRFGQERDTLTSRALRALSHPAVRLLGHPTGRRLGLREAYDIDLAPLAAAAAAQGKALEVNGSPERLDLDGADARQALAAGASFCLDTDAHSTDGLDFVDLAVGTARRGWLTAGDVWNTLPLAALLERLRAPGREQRGWAATAKTPPEPL